MSLYREFPFVSRVPWKLEIQTYSIGMGMGMSMGMALREWEGMKALHFPFATQSRLIRLRSTHVIGEKIGIGEMTQF